MTHLHAQLPARALLCGLLTLLLLVLSATAASAQADASTNSLAVVQRFVAALNAEDQAAALDLIADDVNVPTNKTCPPGHVCRGKAPIELDVNQGVQAHARYTLVDPQVVGTTVTATVERRLPNLRAPGVERLVSKLSVEIRDGNIVSYQNADDQTDPQTAAFYAFQRSQAAAGQLPPAQLPSASRPSALPNTGEAPPSTWPAGVAAAGLLLLGIGLVALVWSRTPRPYGFESRPRHHH